MLRMNLTTPLPSVASRNSVELTERNAAALLFKYIEQLFGAACTHLKTKRNSLIFFQGSKLSHLYLIKKGEILLTRASPDGNDVLLSVLGPGEFFGEGALLSGASVTFSANATRRSELLMLPSRKFKLLLEDPHACIMLLETIARRCDDAWIQLEVLGCNHVKDKVRSGLLWLSDRIGVATREGVRIDLNLTQVARMVGCARESLSREVRELKRQRAVDVRHSNGRRSFFVVNPEGLAQPA
jgi:CRP/FNR family transcriptional regulator, cyclic AMP receptor protein